MTVSSTSTSDSTWTESYRKIRLRSEQIAAPLSSEDCCAQSMPDASPIKWHLAHTTWFFETFLLTPLPAYKPFDDTFQYLFNSYYNSIGEQFKRANRGLLTRPSLSEVLEYRRHVDQAMLDELQRRQAEATDNDATDNDASDNDDWLSTLILGFNHEQQHQELMWTDVLHLLSQNPLAPAYFEERRGDDCQTDDSTGDAPPCELASPRAGWLDCDGGMATIGHTGDAFCFDNELPQHETYVAPFQLRQGCVTNGEYLAFLADDGYRRPEFWLSLGWAEVQQHGWQSPLYWREHSGQWCQYSLYGLQPLDERAPVRHLSYFEADAFARWAGCRLPTEFEWEVASARAALEAGLWQWTSSAYAAYPGFRPAAGAIGEYNGKFMCNQYVLRGGSWATPPGHYRRTYRNFFPPEARWQFTGLRLARDA